MKISKILFALFFVLISSVSVARSSDILSYEINLKPGGAEDEATQAELKDDITEADEDAKGSVYHLMRDLIAGGFMTEGQEISRSDIITMRRQENNPATNAPWDPSTINLETDSLIALDLLEVTNPSALKKDQILRVTKSLDYAQLNLIHSGAQSVITRKEANIDEAIGLRAYKITDASVVNPIKEIINQVTSETTSSAIVVSDAAKDSSYAALGSLLSSNQDVQTVPIQSSFAETNSANVVGLVNQLRKNQAPIIVASPGYNVDYRDYITYQPLLDMIESGRITIEEVAPDSQAAKDFADLFEENGPAVGVGNRVEQIRLSIEQGKGLN